MTPDEIEKTRVCEREIWAQAFRMPESEGTARGSIRSLLAVACRAAFDEDPQIAPEEIFEEVSGYFEAWLEERFPPGGPRR